MLIDSLMHDKQRHLCRRCERWGRGVDWQPLLGEYMHYECWLELATETIRAKKVDTPSRAERIGTLLGDFSCSNDPEQIDLF